MDRQTTTACRCGIRLGSFLLLFGLASALAQSAERASPEDVGLSSARLARVGEFARAEMEKARIAGAVSLVARRGHIVLFEAVGKADIEEGRPMREDSLFRIASMTKPIVSLAVLMLHEEGRFLLDDPVSRFIPELGKLRVAVVPEGVVVAPEALETVPAAREITIHDLLTHRSGFTYGPFNQGPVGELYRRANLFAVSTNEELVRKLAGIPLVHQPGTTFEYSHSTDVLGRLVEVVSGQSLDQFLSERVFLPLGMKDTKFYLSAEEAERLVTLYQRGEPSLKAAERGRESRLVVGPKTWFSGGAGLLSTASDYHRFLQMLLNGGELEGRRLVGRKTVELMTRDHVGMEVPLYPGYGFGLGVAVRGDLGKGYSLGSEGEYTWAGIFNTFFWVDPKEELILIYLSNVSPFDLDDGWRFKTLVYQALVP
jgi:CubicO group peptidase (beta-lactamase class C family)